MVDCTAGNERAREVGSSGRVVLAKLGAAAAARAGSNRAPVH